MKSIFISIFFFTVTAVGAIRSEASGDTYRFQPCDYWQAELGWWKCTYLAPFIEVATVDEINRIYKIMGFQDRKISQLEERLAKLER